MRSPEERQLSLELPMDPITLEAAMREAFARCPGLSRRTTFGAVLQQPPLRRCLEIMAEIRLKKGAQR